MYEYPNPPAVPDFLIEQRKNPANKSAAAMRRILERYEIDSGGVKTPIEITEIRRRPYYRVVLPDIGVATQCMLSSLRERLLDSFQLGKTDPVDSETMENLKAGFKKEAAILLDEDLPNLDPKTRDYLILMLQNDVFGLGRIEILLNDSAIEEVVVNSVREPVRVYHRKYGWIKTNIRIKSENDILNQAHRVARGVGREITTLNPHLDACLLSGDRVNATLSPISTKGHTLTIRKFSRDPWTVDRLHKQRDD